MLGMVELIRLMRNVGKGMETREQVRWPEHPDVLDRLWKEALGLHDHASKVFGAQKRYLNAARANAADPEVIDANEVRDAKKRSTRMALDPPVTTPVLSEVIRSGGERWTMDRVLEQCPSLRAAMALPRDAWPDAGSQSVVLQGATLDAAEFLLEECLKLLDRFNAATIPPLVSRLDDLASQRPNPRKSPEDDVRTPEAQAEMPDRVTLASSSGDTLPNSGIPELGKVSPELHEIASTQSFTMIKILFLAANPKDTNPLRLGEEARAIKERLRLADLRDQFVFEQEHAVRVTDLQGHLLHHQPHIVHFSGHGSKTGRIILENALGRSKAVTAVALKALFSTLKDNIRCVVLNACYSEYQARGIAESIDCVVGMGRAIDDSSAVAFAASFYQGLGYGRSIQTAFELGKGQIHLLGLPGKDVPQLKVAPGADAAKLYLIEGGKRPSSGVDADTPRNGKSDVTDIYGKGTIGESA